MVVVVVVEVIVEVVVVVVVVVVVAMSLLYYHPFPIHTLFHAKRKTRTKEFSAKKKNSMKLL